MFKMNRKTLKELKDTDVLDDPSFIKANGVIITVLPPDPAALTDEDNEVDEDDDFDNLFSTARAQKYMSEQHILECIIPSSEEDEEELSDTAGSSKAKYKKTNKQRRISDESDDWKKVLPTYTRLLPEGEQDKIKLEELRICFAEKNPVEVFESIFTNDIVDHIVQETVRYASTVKNNPDFTLSGKDFKAFMGILILTGYNKLPFESLYWSDDGMIRIDLIKKCMSRNRYLEIKKYIHFADNNQNHFDKKDQFYKVKPLLKMINERFKKWGIFEKQLSVDEVIVGYFRYRSEERIVREQTSPIGFGYKLWAMCGPSGYCYNFDLYTGKTSVESDRENLPLHSRVVLDMLDCISDPASYSIYFKHLFTNEDLLIRLQKLGFRATGSLKENQLSECPLKDWKILREEPRGQFDYRFNTNSEIFFVKWNDTKCVSVATNHDSIEPICQASRRGGKSKEKVLFPQPHVLKNHELYVRGVDKNELLVNECSIIIRGSKWYWPLFTRIIDMSIVNAWIIYKLVNKSKMSLSSFRHCIIIAYLNQGQISEQIHLDESSSDSET